MIDQLLSGSQNNMHVNWTLSFSVNNSTKVVFQNAKSKKALTWLQHLY